VESIGVLGLIPSLLNLASRFFENYRQASETKSIKTKKLNSEMKNNTSKHPQTHPTPTNPPSYANTNNEE
jgi:hypothetical protein